MTAIKYIKNIINSLIILLLIQCEPVVPQQSLKNKSLIFDDFDYEEIVGNVKIVPFSNGNADYLGNPIMNISGEQTLLLDFDILSDQFENLSFKVFHCNKDWTKSLLRDMEFLNQINNYRVTDFDYSLNTTTPYINYQVTLPKPKISGNYLIAVFRRSNPNDILFTRKFLVTDGIATVDHLVRISTTISKRNENHQLEFSVNYGGVQVNSPLKDVSIAILQNHNWRTTISQIAPSLIKPNENTMEFRHLDLRTNFPGGNEFRFFDMRTLNATGRNVARLTNVDED